MQPTDTAQEHDPMTTPRTSDNWLRRRAAALIPLLVLVGVCVAILGSLRAQAHTPQAVVAPAEVAAPAISPRPNAHTYEQSMQRLRDLNEAAAPSLSVSPNTRAYERSMQRLLELNTMDASPALTQADWQAKAEQATEYMVRAHEATITAAALMPPSRDEVRRTGPY